MMAESNRKLDIFPFSVVLEDQIANGDAWINWMDDFTRQLRYFRISDAVDQLDALLIYGGPEVKRLCRSLEDPKIKGTEFDKALEKLTRHFTPKKNKHYSRYTFFKMRPQLNETTVEYASRLREKALTCGFLDMDDRILDHLMQTTESRDFVKTVLSKPTCSLQEALQYVQVQELTNMQVDAIGHHKEDNSSINRISKARKYMQEGNIIKCKYCNGKHVRDKTKCPAFQKRCYRCNELNHFEVVCAARQSRDRNEIKKMNNEIEFSDGGESDSSTSSSELCEDFVRHLMINNVNNSNKNNLKKDQSYIRNEDNASLQRCNYCGIFSRHVNKIKCPAYRKRCFKCRKWHHFAAVCSSLDTIRDESLQRQGRNDDHLDARGNFIVQQKQYAPSWKDVLMRNIIIED